jgi:predicted SnoaL-like aldol condensation-catalyzing enzyme
MYKHFIIAVCLAFGFASSVLGDSKMTGPLQENKDIVTGFFTMALFDGDVDKAFDLYVGDIYIQHNPSVEDGPEAARAFLKSVVGSLDGVKGEIVRVVAEGNLVVLHIRWRTDQDADGSAVDVAAGIDIFRIEGGKIVEHWDVNQPVPSEAKNDNSMF